MTTDFIAINSESDHPASVWVKGTSSLEAYYAVSQYDSDGNFTYCQAFYLSYTSSDWTENTHSIHVNPGTTKVKLILGLNNPGPDDIETVWFDDIYFGGEAFPTSTPTATPTPTSTPTPTPTNTPTPTPIAHEVCGEVSGTWIAAESPYIVTCDITVPVGSLLTIEPGVEVRFATDDASNSGEYTDRTELTVMGTLLAQGTSAQPISFTSASEAPAPGDWGQIRLDSASSSSVISYSRIEYATRGILTDGTWWTTISHNMITQNSEVGVLAQWAPSMIISNTITENGGNGLYLLYSHSTVDGNRITNNSGNGVHLFYYSSPDIIHNTIAGNGTNGIYIQSGSYEARPRINYNTITGNASYGIYNENIPDIDATNNEWGTTDPVQVANAIYDFNDNPDSGLVAFSSATVIGEGHVSGNVTWSGTRVISSHVWIDPGATLTIQASAQIRFADSYGLFNQGTLLVQGTSAAPVIFTTNSGTPMPGAWAMIKFNFAEGVIDYAQIRYARRGLFMYHSSPTISNSLVANSLESGILAHMSSNANLNNDTITDNGAHGLYLLYSNPTVESTTISRNGGSGIWAFYYSSPVVTYSRLTNNTGDGFTVQDWSYEARPRINYCSLYGNGGYSFRHGGSEDIDATYNYWGTTDPAIIEECIYDHNDNASLGTVDFSNYTEIPQSEYEALVALYNSTDGANWSNNSGWLETNTPCNWYGVTCSAGHVTGLSLGLNQLSGSIPPELGNLTNLQSLFLNQNQLSGSIPPELGNLVNLQDLRLYNNNQLSGSIPPQLGNLTNLQSLRLSGNQLSGSIPLELSNLVNLQDLGLAGNQLSGSIPPELGNLVYLQDLGLSNNQLTGSIPPELGNLTNLQGLWLHNNQLTGSIPTELGNLINLRDLGLISNQLSGSIPPELGNLTNLRDLGLGYNQLSGGIPPELGNLVSLRWLNLNSNELSGSIPPQLGDLANLESLHLTNNQLSGSIPPELGNLVSLRLLSLWDNQLSGALPGTLTNLVNLDTFWFHYTDLCEPADTAFQTWLAGINNLSSTGVICPGPGLPYTVTLVAYPTSLTVGNTSSLTATVKDQYDNNVPDGTAVLFETSLGSLGSVTVTKTTVSGIVTASLTSQVVGTAVVTATSDSIYDTVNVTFYRTCRARVNDDPTDYTTVQAAVDAANDGDTVKVAGYCAGVEARAGVTQTVYISKTLTLRGGYTITNWTVPDPVANPTTLDAEGLGRVLYITGDISPTIERLRITGGDATGLGGTKWDADAGGGVYVITATATISNNQVFNNTAVYGGGLCLQYSGATLSGNTFTANTAYGNGGGLYLGSSDAILSDNVVTANTSGWSGGGLNLCEKSDATLIGNAISANTAAFGGGLSLLESDAMLSSSIVISNTAYYGGGLHLDYSDATLVNNLVVNNQATGAGSGLYIERSSPHLLHTTIARNTGGDGSGIYVPSRPGTSSTVALTNTILVSHTVGITVTAGNTATLEGTLWYGNGQDTGGAGTILIGTVNVHGDPAFINPTAFDYHLSSGSAAIDAGVDAGVVTDIDGDPRPWGLGVDMGADEYYYREVEIPLQVGWNHISLPVEPITPYTAEGVCIEINSQGGDVAEIDRWYASGWDGHICGLPFNDFAIELGSDYFIKSSAVSTWTIEGYRVTTPVPLDLQIGWNSIGIPHTDAYTAESLCEEINDQCGDGTAIEVDRWYASGWDGHICGLPFNNFAIEIGKGYFVKASGECTVTPSLLAATSSPRMISREAPEGR